MRKALLTLGTGLAIGAGLGSGAAVAQDRYTICYVTFSLQVQYFQKGVQGAQAAADELGVDLVVLDPQADAGRQVTQFEDCIARQSDAIIVDPIESGSLGGAIEEAGAAGIPIATLDTPIDSPHVVVQLGIPQYDASREFGQFVAGYIVGKLDGEANVGIMLASTEVQLARRDGFLEALSAVPGATVVAEGDGRNILERATAEAEDMLTAHPEINVIYATGDPQIAFFGWDDIPEPFIAPLEDGRLVGFLMQKPEVGGEMAVRLLVQHLNGEEIPATYGYNPTVVTKHNMDQYR
jgi:ribose transport system substrate-binding protein